MWCTHACVYSCMNVCVPCCVGVPMSNIRNCNTVMCIKVSLRGSNTAWHIYPCIQHAYLHIRIFMCMYVYVYHGPDDGYSFLQNVVYDLGDSLKWEFFFPNVDKPLLLVPPGEDHKDVEKVNILVLVHYFWRISDILTTTSCI